MRAYDPPADCPSGAESAGGADAGTSGGSSGADKLVESNATTDSGEVDGSSGAELTFHESVVLENLVGPDFQDHHPRMSLPQVEDCDYVKTLEEVLNHDFGPLPEQCKLSCDIHDYLDRKLKLVETDVVTKFEIPDKDNTTLWSKARFITFRDSHYGKT